MPEPLLTTAEAAAYLHLAVQTLCDWRWRGHGPAYIRLGRRIRYRPEVLDAWLAAHTHAPEEALQRVPTPALTVRPRLLPRTAGGGRGR